MTQSGGLESRLRAVLDRTISRTSPKAAVVRWGVAVALLLCGIVGTARLTAQTPTPPASADALTPERAKAQQDMNDTVQRMKAVAIAALMYKQDNDEVFPPANRYVKVMLFYTKQTQKQLGGMDAFKSVLDAPGTISFKINGNIAGKSLSRLPSPATTVLFYEGTLGKPLFRYGVGTDMQAIIGYADGHVKMVTSAIASKLDWTPKLLPATPQPISSKEQYIQQVRAANLRRQQVYMQMQGELARRQTKQQLIDREAALKRRQLQEAEAQLQAAKASLQARQAEQASRRAQMNAQVEAMRVKAPVLARSVKTVEDEITRVQRQRIVLELESQMLELQLQKLRKMQSKPKP